MSEEEANVMDQFRLDVRVALITGGSKGLGKSMGLGLAQAGASVVLCSRHGDESEAAAQEIASQTDQKCLGLQADVTKEDEVKTLFAKVMDEFGRLDVLINSAGMNIRHPIEDFPLEEFEQIKAGSFDCKAGKSLRLRGKISQISAEEEVIVDGEHIHIA